MSVSPFVSPGTRFDALVEGDVPVGLSATAGHGDPAYRADAPIVDEDIGTANGVAGSVAFE
jgi:hypothetical protein